MMSLNRKTPENDSFAVQLEEQLISYLFSEAEFALETRNFDAASSFLENIKIHYGKNIPEEVSSKVSRLERFLDNHSLSFYGSNSIFSSPPIASTTPIALDEMQRVPVPGCKV